jgi:poly-gamma-glutamate capsule biosynthesis protein CapA/YwtB (metallophosphatase superfamily)
LEKQVIVAAVGDLAPLRKVTECQPGVNLIWNYLRQTDLAIANLELPLTHSAARIDKAVTLKADPAIAPSLSEAGIDVVTVANNHALDYGAEGLLETIRVVQESGTVTVGGGKDLDDAMRPAFVDVGDTRFAILGFCSALPTGYAAGMKRPGIAPIRAHAKFFIDSMTLDEQPGMSPWVETTVNQADLKYACKIVEEAKKQADFVIVNAHWGIPNGWCAAFQGPLADYQQPMAHALVEAGADLIVGHHPHVIHGVEKYKSGLIAYSLGNFLFHSMSEDHELKLTVSYPPYKVDSLEQGEAREAVIMELIMEKKKLVGVRFLPIGLNPKGEPEFLDHASSVNVLQRLNEHSKEFAVNIAIEESVGKLKL